MGQGSQVTLGFCGERPENQADGREGGGALREGTSRRRVWSGALFPQQWLQAISSLCLLSKSKLPLHSFGSEGAAL